MTLKHDTAGPSAKPATSPSATLFVVCAVQFLTPFMFSAVGVALPTIGSEFSASAVQLGLVEMVYILAVALFLLPAGRFADIHGRRRVFMAGTVLITVATLVLALAESIAFTFRNIATWINYAASLGVVFLFSLYLQMVKGLSPQMTGLVLVVQPVIQAAFAPVAGALSDRYPPERIATVGMGLVAIALAIAAMLGEDASLAMIGIVLSLLGLGFGLFSTPNMTAIMGCVTPRHYGVASSMIATMRAAGMLTSMTLITVILSIFLGDAPVSAENRPAFLAAMHTALIAFSALSFVGILFSLGRLRPTIATAREKQS